MNLDTLPFDVQLNILNRLNFEDLTNLSQVNKSLNAVSNDNQFWKSKLIKDVQSWRKISSRAYKELIGVLGRVSDQDKENDEIKHEEVIYKDIYFRCCPDLMIRQEILKKLETFQEKNFVSSTERGVDSFGAQSTSNLTLSTLPMAVLSQIKEFIMKNVLTNLYKFNILKL